MRLGAGLKTAIAKFYSPAALSLSLSLSLLEKTPLEGTHTHTHTPTHTHRYSKPNYVGAPFVLLVLAR